MKVRPIRAIDIDAMLCLARLNVKESRFNGLPFDEQKVRANLERMAQLPRSDHFFCGAFNSADKLTGYLIGSIESYFFCDHTVATSVFFFVDPTERGGFAALKLILAFRAWAKNRKASEMYIGIAGGVLVERTGKFLQRLGMRFTGGNYSMWLASQS
jgi:hypothetical protein